MSLPNHTDLHASLNRHAHEAGEAFVDLPTVLEDGSRRRRRRRGLVMGGAALATTAVLGAVALAPALLSGSAETTPTAPAAQADGVPFSYATHTSVHIGGTVVDAPVTPQQLLRVDTGVVVLGEHSIWLVTADTEPRRLGSVEGTPVPFGVGGYGDENRAAWVSIAAGSTVVSLVDVTDPDLEVTRVELPSLAAVSDRHEQIRVPVVLDGTMVYVQDQSGIRSVDMGAPTQPPTQLADAGTDLELLDVNAGVMVWNDTRDDSAWFGPSLGQGTPLGASHGTATLSPDSRYLLSEMEDVGTVTELSTGRGLPIGNPEYGFQIGFEWSDDHTFFGLSYDVPSPTREGEEPLAAGTSAPHFFSCEMPSSGTELRCSTVAEAPGTDGNVTVPHHG